MKIACCIVTYFPNLEALNQLISVLKNKCMKVYLIDNTPAELPIDNIKVDFILRYKENKGLGKAYNDCLELAQSEGIDWLLFLDQDTKLSKPIDFSSLFSEMDILDEKIKNKIGIISLNYSFSTKLKPIPNSKFVLAKYVVGSGMLVNVKLLGSEKFLENLFLYSIDIEYSARIRRLGYYILVYENDYIQHQAGDNLKPYSKFLNRFLSHIASKITKKEFLNFYPYYSNPIRYYIMIRNNLYLIVRRKIEIKYILYVIFQVLVLYEVTRCSEFLRLMGRALYYAISGKLDNDNRNFIIPHLIVKKVYNTGF